MTDEKKFVRFDEMAREVGATQSPDATEEFRERRERIRAKTSELYKILFIPLYDATVGDQQLGRGAIEDIALRLALEGYDVIKGAKP